MQKQSHSICYTGVKVIKETKLNAFISGLGFFRKKPISSRTPGRNWKKLEESGLFRKKVEEIGIK